MRFIFFQLLILAPGIVEAGGQNSEIRKCEVAAENVEQQSFTIDTGSNRIAVIGWYHGTTERQLASKAFASALNEAKQGNCKATSKAIDRLLKKLNGKIQEGQRVLNALEMLYTKKAFASIGLELTPNQYASEFIDSVKKTDYALQLVPIFKKLCPKNAVSIENLALVYHGPEFEFARKKSNLVKLIPMGDEELVKATFDMLSEETRNFPTHLSELSPEAAVLPKNCKS